MRLAPLISLAFFCAACTGKPTGGACDQTADCTVPGQVCVADILTSTQTRSYCTTACISDRDCPDYQSCRIGVDAADGTGKETRLCVNRVRRCSPIEYCNGLDNDCDGVIGGPDCRVIYDCLDDAPCGAFVCQALDNQPRTLCGPRNTAASVADHAACTDPSQCANGLCETGTCSPLCRPGGSTCTAATTCVRAVGPPSRPLHNACQRPCKTSADCTAPQECVWRDVHQGGSFHAFVCSLSDAGRKALGSPCTNNTPAGDDECANGLCFGNVCTRPCEAAFSPCSDVNPAFVCKMRVALYYGTDTFTANLCASPR